MDLREYAPVMASYNVWMNDKLYGRAARLDDADRKRDLGAYFKSLHGTFNHILLLDKAYLASFRDEHFELRSFDQELHTDFDELGADRRATDEAICVWAATLYEAALARPMRYFDVARGELATRPGWCMVLQLFNHQTHHRGQATTLLKQLGVDPGVTDFLQLPSLPSAALGAAAERAPSRTRR